MRDGEVSARAGRLDWKSGRVGFTGKNGEFGKASLRARDVIFLKQVTTVYAAKGKIESAHTLLVAHSERGCRSRAGQEGSHKLRRDGRAWKENRNTTERGSGEGMEEARRRVTMKKTSSYGKRERTLHIYGRPRLDVDRRRWWKATPKGSGHRVAEKFNEKRKIVRRRGTTWGGCSGRVYTEYEQFFLFPPHPRPLLAPFIFKRARRCRSRHTDQWIIYLVLLYFRFDREKKKKKILAQKILLENVA